jgi:hypothetical protein
VVLAHGRRRFAEGRVSVSLPDEPRQAQSGRVGGLESDTRLGTEAI